MWIAGKSTAPAQAEEVAFFYFLARFYFHPILGKMQVNTEGTVSVVNDDIDMVKII